MVFDYNPAPSELSSENYAYAMFSPLKFGGCLCVCGSLRPAKCDKNLRLCATVFPGQLYLRRFSGKNGLGSPNLLLLRRSMAYQSGSCFRLMACSSGSPSFARAEAVEPIWVREKHEHRASCASDFSGGGELSVRQVVLMDLVQSLRLYRQFSPKFGGVGSASFARAGRIDVI